MRITDVTDTLIKDVIYETLTHTLENNTKYFDRYGVSHICYRIQQTIDYYYFTPQQISILKRRIKNLIKIVKMELLLKNEKTK